MSYILEALKKAEAERNTGTLRAVYLPAMQVPSSHRPPSGGPRPWYVLAGTTAVIGLCAVWMLRPTAAGAPSSVPSPPAYAPETANRLLEQGKTTGTAAAQDEIEKPDPGNRKGRGAELKSNLRTSGEPATPRPAKTARDDKAGESAASRSRAAAARHTPDARVVTQAAAASGTTGVNVQEKAAGGGLPDHALLRLDDDTRRALPSLVIGGYIWSTNPADRSVVINNRLLREGEEIAPDLRLERLLPDGIVLGYKGRQYRTDYQGR